MKEVPSFCFRINPDACRKKLNFDYHRSLFSLVNGTGTVNDGKMEMTQHETKQR
jgi:hypothetical protein